MRMRDSVVTPIWKILERLGYKRDAQRIKREFERKRQAELERIARRLSMSLRSGRLGTISVGGGRKVTSVSFSPKAKVKKLKERT